MADDDKDKPVAGEAADDEYTLEELQEQLRQRQQFRPQGPVQPPPQDSGTLLSKLRALAHGVGGDEAIATQTAKKGWPYALTLGAQAMGGEAEGVDMPGLATTAGLTALDKNTQEAPGRSTGIIPPWYDIGERVPKVKLDPWKVLSSLEEELEPSVLKDVIKHPGRLAAAVPDDPGEEKEPEKENPLPDVEVRGVLYQQGIPTKKIGDAWYALNQETGKWRKLEDVSLDKLKALVGPKPTQYVQQALGYLERRETALNAWRTTTGKK